MTFVQKTCAFNIDEIDTCRFLKIDKCRIAQQVIVHQGGVHPIVQHVFDLFFFQ